MGKTLPNTALFKLEGKIDGWVYRRRNGQVIVAKKPDFSEVVPSAAQLRHRERFLKALAYGQEVLKDPAKAAPYKTRAEGTLGNGFALAVRDYMLLPLVKELDLVSYNGQVGDEIKIDAADDFEVVSVKVTIKHAGTGAVIEEGLATLVAGFWYYHGKTQIAAGQTVLVEAEARDRAGHDTALSETWTA